MDKFFETNLDLRNPDSLDENMVKKIERYIRSSYEYRKFCLYIRDEKGMTKCDYFKDIFSDDQDDITTEVHHNLFTLYDLVFIVGLSMIVEYTNKETILLPIDIAKRVIELHLNNQVSVIVLSKSIHEAFHSGLYKYNQEHAIGDYEKFVEKYHEYIPTATLARIKEHYGIDIDITKYEKEETTEI